jgi:hypothetical protein
MTFSIMTSCVRMVAVMLGRDMLDSLAVPKPVTLGVIILTVIILRVIMPSLILLNVDMLSVVYFVSLC